MISFLRRSRLRSWLIVLSILAALQLLLAIVSFWQSTTTRDEGFALPGPSRIAAIVSTLEASSPSERTAILTAISDERFSGTIVMSDPVADRNASAHMLPGVAMLIEAELSHRSGRNVEAWLVGNAGAQNIRRTPFELWSTAPLQVSIALAPNEWLLLEAIGDHANFVFGLPPGFWAGFLGVTVAFAALALLWWSLRPLERIERAMEQFAMVPVAVPIEPQGPRETQRIVAVVNRMQSQLANLFQERQVMFGALSHDLRTLLTRLRLRVDRIEDAIWREKADADLAAMNEVIENGLALARLDAARGGHAQRVDIAELLREVVRSTELAPDDLVISREAKPLAINADPHILLRGIRNLVDNAFRYGGDCSVAVAFSEGRLTIDVADTGPGIDAAELERLVRPFERGAETRTMKDSGSGLGLAIAKRAAESAGGSLTLYNRAAGGLVARMELPVKA
ncbi:hypothetical protein CD351_04775 [Erythrobacter sp. KY5]|uniref:ATP-binding protein n=1 Tax=Erythrobacter sp. KY5 TaxID=2011159 RepID=UPI000DBF33FA|nr:ATP-binding protein [Erythrobacter sp. KY5]AWW73735.1 hypothetical protein CD351_04775 [Erythrobacter sp. KY5]